MSGALRPGDADDARLAEQVAPAGWRNPLPSGAYDLVVVGGGTAGLVSAHLAAALGARTALIERALLGGDCLVTGCVPSKSLLHSAREHAADGPAAALSRLRRMRARLAAPDSAERLAAAGVDVFFGHAAFVSGDRVVAGGATLTFRRCILAAGAAPVVPDVPGLAPGRMLTSETVFGLAELPRSLAVLGGGPIGCELSQALARLGSRVTLVHRGPRLLPRDDEDAAALVARSLQRDGVDVRLGAQAVRAEGGTLVVRCDRGEETRVEAESVLAAAGRRARTAELGLARAGVELDERGFVRTDDRLRTTCRRVFAAGDVAGRWQFTHAADAMARLAVQNALLPVKASLRGLVVPWCTYTSPEVAHAGVSSAEARELGLATVTAPFADVDRSVLEGEEEGFARLHVEPRSGRLRGVTIAGPHAGELIAEAVLALRHGITAARLESSVRCYPSRSDALRRAAAAWRRTKLKPWMPRLLRRWYGLLR